MIEVEMSKDIRETEPKVIGPFTRRQLLCSIIGLAYSVPVFFLLGDKIDLAAKLIVCIILMAPAIVFGWIKLYGIPMEKFVVHLIRTYVLGSTVRACVQENVYSIIADSLAEEDASASAAKKKRPQKAEKSPQGTRTPAQKGRRN